MWFWGRASFTLDALLYSYAVLRQLLRVSVGDSGSFVALNGSALSLCCCSLQDQDLERRALLSGLNQVSADVTANIPPMLTFCFAEPLSPPVRGSIDGRRAHPPARPPSRPALQASRRSSLEWEPGRAADRRRRRTRGWREGGEEGAPAARRSPAAAARRALRGRRGRSRSAGPSVDGN